MVEFREQNIGFEYIKTMPIFYHSHYLGDQPVRLINVEDKFLLATIAVRQIDDALIAQMKARLRQLDKKLGCCG